ncbi:MAG: NTP transferase domain-containing protein [Candidatus Poseidoniaceae archaeon]|nr:NTP transferase domain-containing protein [Candidatus Poseidoniaceae archaeon]
MLTGIILAGGKSTRMGEDKALLRNNVSRLSKELKLAGCNRVIVMCGDESRRYLFSEDCIVDEGGCLAESLQIVLSKLKGEVQLVTCDSYLADCELFQRINGVPIDYEGKRQPLLARVALPFENYNGTKISEMFACLPSCRGGIKASNANTPEEFERMFKPTYD